MPAPRWRASKEECKRIFDAFVEAGGNFIDGDRIPRLLLCPPSREGITLTELVRWVQTLSAASMLLGACAEEGSP